MYIGKLNQKLDYIEYQVFKKDTKQIPKLKEAGNPFQGEKLAISWKEILETGIDLHVKLDGKYMINKVVLFLATKSNPTSVKLYINNKEEERYCYSAETDKTIREKELALAIEDTINEFVVEICTEFEDVLIERIEIYGADFSGEQIFPIPSECVLNGEKEIPVSVFDSYSYDCEIGRTAGLILKEKYAEYANICIEECTSGKIQFLEDKNIPENGYSLRVDESEVKISASDLRGMVYGAETFIKLIKDTVVPACEIKDAPRMEFRGVHLMLPHPDEFAFAKRFVKYVLSPMGYNNIIMEIAGGMEFESHPEINAAVEEAFIKGANGEWPLFPHKEAGMGKTVKKELLADFVAYCRSFGIDVIPEIQSLGHVQFMTLPHPDIAERPEKSETEKVDEREADIPPNEFYGHSYCPSNPKSYEILFDLMDEIIEVFKPRKYVHMGHDEVYQIGVCPICKEKDPAELFAQDVNRIYEYLQKKGLKMMIWADMLQPVTKYKTWAAIDMIPKDIVLLDFIWYFHMDKDIEDNLLPKGFEVILGNMYSSHFPRYDSRIAKEGISGAQVSSWVITSEDVMAREGKIYEFLYSGQMLWSADYSNHARYSYDVILSQMMPMLRQKLGQREYPSLKANKVETVFADFGEYNYNKKEFVRDFKICQRADSIIFEHVATEKLTRIPWIELDCIGKYIVIYADGSKEEIPVTYAGNVGWWNRRHNEPFKAKYYRHNGYQGTSYWTEGVGNMYRFEWINPKPDKKIEIIQYIPDTTFATDVYISRVIGVKEENAENVI